MGVELTAIGGYNEVGRQCTAIRVDDEVVIVDLGLHLDHYIRHTADDAEEYKKSSARALRKAGAIPDWTSIKDWRKDVTAILLTHAHLDHIGAVPYMAKLFDCPIYGSPFTIAFLRQLLADKQGVTIDNDLHTVKNKITLSPKITVEFIPMTHSTVDARILAIHTPYGIIVVDNDYKLDNHPTLGEAPDYARLEALQGKVIAHVAECLYAPAACKTPSERTARQMLEEVLLEQDFSDRAVFVSTFSSHIARLKTIMEVGSAMGRKVVFMGRSPAKYLQAAQDANIIDLPKEVTVLKYGSQIKKFFSQKKDLSKFLIMCTGHMGEPKAFLSRLVNGDFPYKLKPEDVVVFSSRVIPVPSIVANRAELARRIKAKHVRMFDNVHVSGHASREDIRWMLQTLQAKHLIPNHGIPDMHNSLIELAREVGYTPERIHNLREGDRVTIIK